MREDVDRVLGTREEDDEIRVVIRRSDDQGQV